MTIRILGALCIILGCGGFGFMIAGNVRKEIFALQQLISALEFMECELNYRMTPLPQLFRLTAAVARGCIGKFFDGLSAELEKQTEPNVRKCVTAVIRRCPDIPVLAVQQITELSRSLGTFDLIGQLKCIKSVNDENRRLLETLMQDHTVRFRSYKTLGLCAGAALVILFI